jgi:RNA polymerase sigma-B factor
MTSETITTRPRSQQLRAMRSVPVEALFERLADGDGAAREALVHRFLPLARSLARRYANSSVPNDDLAQVASLALLKAVDRFDPQRGYGFEAFAVPTILGELRRYFRDAAWAVHVARGAKERAHDVQEATEHLFASNGRSPTVQQLAQFLELSQEEVLDALQASESFVASSLDAPLQSCEEDGDTTLGGRLGAEDSAYERVENVSALSSAIAHLSEKERDLLRMRFGAGMTQVQIGCRLGVSQMQVSRLLRATLERLRLGLVDESGLSRQSPPTGTGAQRPRR